MTLGNKLAKLRKENNYTQEQLAQILGVSRQAVSRWESDTVYPEMEKLIRLGQLYDCSMDYLLKDEIEDRAGEKSTSQVEIGTVYYEKKSSRMVGNLPLWHINIGYGRIAKGVFAIGLAARGIVSVGLVSVGVLSVGILPVGVAALGVLAAGLLAVGSISVGMIAVGAIAVGLFALGSMSIGAFSVGSLAIGGYGAIGDSARAVVALGKKEALGDRYAGTYLSLENRRLVLDILHEITPAWLNFAKKLFLLFLP